MEDSNQCKIGIITALLLTVMYIIVCNYLASVLTVNIFVKRIVNTPALISTIIFALAIFEHIVSLYINDRVREKQIIKSAIGYNYLPSVKILIFRVLIYFIVCTVLPTLLGIKKFTTFTNFPTIITIIALHCLFFITLIRLYKMKPNIFTAITFKNILLSIACFLILLILKGMLLDRLILKIFKTSGSAYSKAMLSLILQYPVTVFIIICVIAPIAEEIFFRFFLIGTLRNKYNVVIAVLISSFLFGISHLNLAQGIHAALVAIVFGFIYIKFKSLLLCIIFHFLLNFISYMFIMHQV